MAKLKLQVEALEVQTFAVTSAEDPARGTVHGASGLDNKSCEYGTCDPGCSAGGSCDEPGCGPDRTVYDITCVVNELCRYRTEPGPYGSCAMDEG